MVLRVFIAGHCFVAWNTKHDYVPVLAPVCFWLLRLPGTRVLAVGIDKYPEPQSCSDELRQPLVNVHHAATDATCWRLDAATGLRRFVLGTCSP